MVKNIVKYKQYGVDSAYVIIKRCHINCEQCTDQYSDLYFEILMQNKMQKLNIIY